MELLGSCLFIFVFTEIEKNLFDGSLSYCGAHLLGFHYLSVSELFAFHLAQITCQAKQNADGNHETSWRASGERDMSK